MRHYFKFIFLFFLIFSFFIDSGWVFAQSSTNTSIIGSKTCTPVRKTTKYKLKKGDYPANVLRQFSLEPVFGNKGTMAEFLKINNLSDPNKVDPGLEVALPFKCEEDVLVYKTSDFYEYRLIENVKIAVAAATPAPPINPEPAQTITPPQDLVLSEIVQSQEEEKLQPKDIEESKPISQDNISEALRYRLICEGEWTGSECITRYTALYASFGGYNNRYDGVDTNAAAGTQRNGLLLSKFNLAAGFGWNNYWNENIKTNLYAELQNNEILPDIRSVPIEGGNRLLTSIQAEVRFEKGRWGVGAGYRQFDKLYYIFNFQNLSNGNICSSADISRCGVQVYSANVSSLFVDLSYLIHQAGKFRFDTELKYFTIASSKVSDINVEAGSGQSFEFSVTHDRVQEYLRGALRYQTSSQDTSIETQKAQEVSIIFSYAWKLKDWSENSIPKE